MKTKIKPTVCGEFICVECWRITRQALGTVCVDEAKHGDKTGDSGDKIALDDGNAWAYACGNPRFKSKRKSPAGTDDFEVQKIEPSITTLGQSSKEGNPTRWKL